MTARFSSDDYAGAARALMPRGPAWSDDPASVQSRLLSALALTLWRSDGGAQDLLADAFPGTTEGLLAAWEASLGLPDPLIPVGTVDQRRNQVVARLVGAGGQSRARFIAFAAQLGFEIEITTYAPCRAGRATAGQPIYSEVWASTWAIHIVANTGGIDPATLKAELDQIRPADTHILLI